MSQTYLTKDDDQLQNGRHSASSTTDNEDNTSGADDSSDKQLDEKRIDDSFMPKRLTTLSTEGCVRKVSATVSYF